MRARAHAFARGRFRNNYSVCVFRNVRWNFDENTKGVLLVTYEGEPPRGGLTEHVTEWTTSKDDDTKSEYNLDRTRRDCIDQNLQSTTLTYYKRNIFVTPAYDLLLT